MASNPSRAYFAWRALHPHQANDPSAIWSAAWLAGGRAALFASSRFIDLVPLLVELLTLLEDGRVERELSTVGEHDQ